MRCACATYTLVAGELAVDAMRTSSLLTKSFDTIAPDAHARPDTDNPSRALLSTSTEHLDPIICIQKAASKRTSLLEESEKRLAHEGPRTSAALRFNALYVRDARGLVAHAAEELVALTVGNTSQDSWVSNLVAVEVQDWENDTIGQWVHELVGLPRSCKWAGLCLAVISIVWGGLVAKPASCGMFQGALFLGIFHSLPHMPHKTRRMGARCTPAFPSTYSASARRG